MLKVGSATALSGRQQMTRFASGGAITMDHRGEFHVKLFSALVSELGKSHKRWLAMQLAEILASRATASAELGRSRTADEASEIAERLICNMASDRPRLSPRLRGPSALPMKKRGH